jgi:hypothetical protein
MSNPAAYVQPIDFEDFDGSRFERLVFAYHARTGKWKSLEWNGQAGPGFKHLRVCQQPFKVRPVTPERAVLCIGRSLSKQLWW